MSRVQLRVQEALRERIEEQASRLGLTLTEYVIGAIADRLDRDAQAATRLEWAADQRELFFELLDDRSELPQPWQQAALLAADIES